MARVLVLEDDGMQLEMRLRLLEMAGHDAVGVRTREEAAKRLEAAEVIVADMVPGCAEFLASIPPGVRVIVLSGRELRPGSLPADRILKKPCPAKDLLAAIVGEV
jgi:CheY-like chemotaxis protein